MHYITLTSISFTVVLVLKRKLFYPGLKGARKF